MVLAVSFLVCFMCSCYWQAEKGSVSLSLSLTGERKMWSSDWAGRNFQLVIAVTLDFVALPWHLPLTVCLVFWLDWKLLGNWGSVPLLSCLGLSQVLRAERACPLG